MRLNRYHNALCACIYDKLCHMIKKLLEFLRVHKSRAGSPEWGIDVYKLGFGASRVKQWTEALQLQH